MPLQLMMTAGRHSPAVQGVAWSTAFAGMGLVLAERRRAEKFVRAKVNATAAEALAILTTSTWEFRHGGERRPRLYSLAGGTLPVSRAKCPVWTI